MSELVPVELEHEGAKLVGQAAFPKGDGPFPAVLVMHNALGLGEHVRETAGRLADLGYLAVATDMYGGGTEYSDPQASSAGYFAMTENPALLRERVVAWFERVRALPQVDSDRVAAIGYCFGGTCVLELARSGADAKAVVSFHGILTTRQPAAQGTVKGEVVAYCGAHDPFAPPEHIEQLRQELVAAAAHHTITTFGDAAHGFTDRNAAALGLEGVEYNALADTLSWAGTVALLEAVLKP
jgi:dienelactone hydrolase